MNRELFVDTAYLIASVILDDDHHDQALELADRIQEERPALVTTRAVLVELGNALAKLRHRHVAIQLLKAMEADPAVEIVPDTENLYREAFALYQNRLDKEWGLTDCMSFVVMTQRGIAEVLTADDHFRQAGFQALMREQ